MSLYSGLNHSLQDMAKSSAMMSLAFTVLLAGIICIQRVSSDDILFLTFTAHKEENGESRSYISKLPVNDTARKFRLSTGALQVSMGKCSGSQASFTLQKRPSFVGETMNVKFKNIAASCNKDQTLNILGLGDANTSFAYQITKAAKRPYIFAYCLGVKMGELRFGERGPYTVYYHNDVLNATHLPMHYFPLSYESFIFNNYRLSLDSVSVKRNTVTVNSVILINIDIRYTSLPEPAYNLVRENFLREVASMNLKNASSFGELDLCYKMKDEQISGFSKVTLVFSGAKWVVTPDNYLAIKKKGVACFGFINASHLPRGISVIGSLMQENNFVEYVVKAGKLGVSGSLAANLGLSCSSTRGT